MTQRRIVCIVNNYNYERFLGECLDSALHQTHPFDAIIVVDDGSTDGSGKLLDRYASEHERLTVVRKKNGGQLSCFNAVVPDIEEDDWVFLLDADDVYPSNYVERMLAITSDIKSDFYYAEAVRFTNDHERPVDACIGSDPPLVLPLTSAITITSRVWLGAPTSALVISGWLYRQMLPYPFERDWTTCADELLVFAASIIGARKVSLPGLGVGYRIHGKNLFFCAEHTPEHRVFHVFRRNRLFNHYTRLAELSPKPDYRGYLREMSLLTKSERRRAKIHPIRQVISRRIRGKIA